MKLKSLIGILSVLIVLSGCMSLPKEEGHIWVDKHLTQCSEEWQEPVLKSNWDNYKTSGESYKEYNQNVTNEGIKKFYKEKGIIINDIKSNEIKMGIVCSACDCLDDTKLYLQIPKEDKSYFLNQGYE